MTKRRNKKHVARSIALYRAQQAGWLDGRTFTEIGDRLGVDRTTAMRNLQDLEGVESLVAEYLEKLSPQIRTKAP